jgi:hypothetical protein
MQAKVTVRTRMCVPIYSNCDNVKLQNDSVTLTFEVGTWFLDATHRLGLVDICANLSYFKIPQCITKLQSGHKRSGDAQTDRQTVRLYYASLRGHKKWYGKITIFRSELKHK